MTEPYSVHSTIEYTEALLSHFLLDVDMDAHHERSTDETVAEYRERLYALVERLTQHLKDMQS